MTDLSPSAQAVLDAFRAEWPDEALKQDCKCLAAALRKAAGYLFPNDTAKQCYDRLLAIATELEGQ
jgi:hypothetical protein